MCRVLYWLLAGLARLVVRSGRAKDLEIIALRHQLAVLQRHTKRPALCDDDRSLLAAIAKACGCRKLRRAWSECVSRATIEYWAPTPSGGAGSTELTIANRDNRDLPAPGRDALLHHSAGFASAALRHWRTAAER